jgi:hypothetical protein
MKLINLEDFVILGAGSEWLWTMVSGIVLAVTFLAIYRQLSLQRDTAAIEQVRAISREWTDERMTRAKLDTLLAVRAGDDPATIVAVGGDVGNFWEDMAYLARGGSIQPRRIYDPLGPAVRVWWGLLAPSAAAYRKEVNDEGIWVDFEWLAGTFAEFDRAAGEPAAFDDTYIAGLMPGLIESSRKSIVRFEQLRAVTLTPASAERNSPPRAARRRGSSRGQSAPSQP